MVLAEVVKCGAGSACKLSIFEGRIFLADVESNELKIALNYKVVRWSEGCLYLARSRIQ